MGLKDKVQKKLGKANYRRLLVGGMRATSLYTKREWLNPAAPTSSAERFFNDE